MYNFRQESNVNIIVRIVTQFVIADDTIAFEPDIFQWVVVISS